MTKEKSSIRKIAYFSTSKCNSKCVMCNIHAKKPTKDLTPKQLKKIISDPLFKNVNGVGVSGGEPSFHKNWKEIYNILCSSLPNLRAITLTTNCVNIRKSIDIIQYYYNQSKKSNIKFSLYISLDGVGEIHDKVRGVKGNFKSAMNVIGWLKYNKINFTCACTISKINVLHLEELRKFCDKNKINIIYRLASKINRLYNNNFQTYHQLLKEEKKILINFLLEEIHRQKRSLLQKITFIINKKKIKREKIYQHIISILKGNKRTSPCPHSAQEAVCLSNNGDLMYCSVASKIIGNCLKDSAKNIYLSNLSHLREIKREKCKDCSHDIIK